MISFDESNKCEFKREFTFSSIKTVIAFLNSNKGGKIYYGVNDDKSIIGITNVDFTCQQISNSLRDMLSPSVMGLFDIYSTEIDGKEVVVLIVASGYEKPYYIKKYGMSPKGCFIRTGTSTNAMSEQLILSLFSKRIRNSLSNIVSPRQDLTYEKLKIYYQENGYSLNNNFLKSLELITEDGKYNYNAYLFSDENSTSIKVAEYRGTTKVDLTMSNEYGYTSIITATNKVLDKLDVHNTTHAVITGEAKRLQWNNIDKKALREAIINAIIHNDYTNEVPPLFEIFSDRIEITSMGGLPDGMIIDEFYEGVSKPRNKVLMRVFKDLNMVEQLGSGILRILDKYDKSVFKISENYIRTTFRYNEFIEKTHAKIETDKNERFNKIMKMINENGNITKKEVMNVFEIKDTMARKILKQMVDQKLIEKVGVARSTKYIFINSAR